MDEPVCFRPYFGVNLTLLRVSPLYLLEHEQKTAKVVKHLEKCPKMLDIERITNK